MMDNYRPQVDPAQEERYVLFTAPCGCKRVEVVQLDEYGELLSGRIEETWCAFGQRIHGMLQAAGVEMATVDTHEEYLRWDHLYFQRDAMLDQHTGNGNSQGWFPIAKEEA